ncbi:MAG TPA: bifunctional (p)ppGpp synthetase/guanosine-3',5'-bis(diphosphate) 3'-pyrophosphohydrolase [Acholeplasmataceae bacterium]|nr:bifunctional (p)ppGpp synthetase/guanosine-3',5'-bis(diphosphate) 3'-pyrophosphohydrolase [Acholeplasmataceae bacterium]HQC30336.1 bifunctional (p)ppGpp synthetase/guanosine-3',5'-bis(diphosphate) 3'-pyrophosphohydrolase [Acholeplasmataceae bacterium]
MTQSPPLLRALEKIFSTYIKKPEDVEMIRKAYFWAEKYHEGQLRKGGDPYITHPVAVATILAELHAGPVTLSAALLHDTVEDTDLSLEDITKEFSKEVSTLVDGVTKLSKLQFKTNVSQAENQQKMLLAMANDIRVVLIKIADRLHNLRTFEYLRADRRQAMAEETLEIYAPLAHRLGMFRIKAEMEDTSLKQINPEMYYYVSGLVQERKSEREEAINEIIDNISSLLSESGMTNFDIKGRIKNIHSIYKKMVYQRRDFEDIYDLLAIRIIVDKVEQCYHALGLIHANFTPIPKRFKDYIAMPKPNMYQSLHTTVLGTDGTLFEVQIRTHEMDEIAELGVAAHWAYKETKTYSHEKEQFEIAQKMRWYADLLKMTADSDDSSDATTFVETVKTDILSSNVYVFTPRGEVKELPRGSTPIDFAYSIHTDVGHTMVGATINNKIAPIDRELQTGDIVSIKTNKNSKPSEDWLKIVKSNSARNKIRAYLNTINRDKLIEQGQDAIERECNKVPIDYPNDDFVKENFQKQGLNDLTGLYLEVGKGLISPKTVVAKLQGKELDREKLLQRQMKRATQQITTLSDTGIYVEGLTSPQIKLANCCNPVYRDQIVGFVSKGSGIVVHTDDCPNRQGLDPNRMIDVKWADNVTRKYATWLKVLGAARPNILTDIISVINAQGVSIAEINAKTPTQFDFQVNIKVLVDNLQSLVSLMSNIKKVEAVYSVKRGIS